MYFYMRATSLVFVLLSLFTYLKKMKLNKQDIFKALETISAPGEGQNMVESGAVKNVVTFGDEVIVDVTITNPSLQAKKKTEVEIMKTIHDLVYEKANG